MSKVKRFNELKIVCDHGAFEPVRGHSTDAGLDLRTPVEVHIRPGESEIIDTGIHMDIPEGWFGKLESKSGLNVMRKIVCLGGVIDSGFTGSIKTRIYNFSDEEVVFEPGDKVVQIVFMPITTPKLVYVEELGEYERGDSGYGSTGR